MTISPIGQPPGSLTSPPAPPGVPSITAPIPLDIFQPGSGISLAVPEGYFIPVPGFILDGIGTGIYAFPPVVTPPADLPPGGPPTDLPSG